VELAIAVVMGAAFGKIVSSLVDDIVMPVIGLALGGVDFRSLAVTVGSATVRYGSFIQSGVDFIAVAAAVFLMVRVYERLRGVEVKKQ
jgi:large conductance mechanosensitive channel